MKKKMKNRTFELFSKYRTLLMGVATILIIIFHFTEDRDIYNYGYFGFIDFYKTYIGSCGVDIFLMLSGLGLYYSWKKNSNYKEFISKRLIKILIPYLIVSIPAYIIRNLVITNIGFIECIKDLLFISLFEYGRNWYWYIFFILVLYVIFPYLYEMIESDKKTIDNEKTILNIFTFITVISMCLFYYANPIFGNINIMLLRVPIFVFGIYLGKLSYNKTKIESKWIFLLFLAIGFIFLRKFNKLMIIRYALGSIGLIICVITIQLFEKLEKKKIELKIVKKILEFFGKYSLEIYLVHVTVRYFFLQYGMPTYRVRYEVLMVIVSIILSIIINRVSKVLTNIIEKKNENVSPQKKKKSMAV